MPGNKIIGRIGYFIRELINVIHRVVVGPLADFLIAIVDWLDKKPSVTYWRKKDRGL